MDKSYDVLVIGAGPTGLACGIETVREGLRLLIVEKGCLVNSIFNYPANMTFFTNRERLEIGDIPFSSTNVKPARAEALEYYRRVTDYYHLPIHYEERVLEIKGKDDAFVVETQTAKGERHKHKTRKVVIATGYYDLPNRMEIPGENLPKVSHYALEPHRFFGRKVAVVGAANSAAVTSLDLFRHGAHVSVICREPELSRHIKYWIRPDLENRIKEGGIRAYFETVVAEIANDWILIETKNGERTKVDNDFVFALTGYHPDVDLLKRAGIKVDQESFRPECNPKTLESNVPGIYLAGVVISGRHTNEIFIENGRFHGAKIIEDLRGKLF